MKHESMQLRASANRSSRARSRRTISGKFSEIVQRRTATEDEVVAVLDLRKEQSVLAARLLSLSCGEEWREARQPFFGRRSPDLEGSASRRVLAGDLGLSISRR